ncbi:MAG: NAD-dependent epimerase/dehydratase family protein [Candidatus Zixiibacteriota bacterium]|nr:MAG: NAD-dependent epimerase/dehydratase family protein [candidate division Zixibacteria bacterium]
MKIFITGATGFIGSHLVKRLSRTDHELYCLVRKTSDVSRLKELNANLVVGDVTDKNSLLEGMKDCDWVAHLASKFEFWVRDKKVYYDVNIMGMRNVMESALKSGIKKVVSVSTAAVYGNAKWPITEETPVGDYRASEYARTKYQGDLIAWRMYENDELPLVVIYPGAVIGPDDPKAAGRYIKNFAQGKMPAQILTDKPFPFVHVKDVCEAVLKALEKDGNIGEKYLIIECNRTFGEVNKMISEISGTPLPKLILPDIMTSFGAAIATGLSRIIGKPPLLDMSIDQIKLMKLGYEFDGGKAERELGLDYSPIRTAFEEAIASFKETGR